MEKEEIIKVRDELEKKVNELENKMTTEMFHNATDEEKKEYVKLIADIKMKLDVLKLL